MCAPCKVLINGGLVDPLAALFAETSPSSAAKELALVAHAANLVYQHASSTGVLKHVAAPDWNGCDCAATVLSWFGRTDIGTDEINAVTQEIVEEMKAVVSGKIGAHDHGEGSDLIGD